MVKEDRSSGIDVIGDVPWGTHFCLFYETRDDLIDVLVPYFKAGLMNNEFCMCITSEPFKAIEVREQMVRAIPGFDKYLEKGQVEIIPYTEWYEIDGVFDSDRVLNGWVEKLHRAQERGYSGLRLSGNTFWLEKAGWKEFLDYESAVNDTIGQYNMIALCTYSLGRCDAGDILDVVSTHQFALTRREGEWKLIENAELKETKKALRESEGRYRGLYESSLDGIVSTDMDGIFINANPAYQRMLGYSEEELRHINYRQLTPARWHDMEDRIIREQVIFRGYSDEYEKEYIRKDGIIFPISIRVWLMKDKLGQPRGLWGIVRDITDRKRAEEELRERGRQLAEAQALTWTGSWVMDLTTGKVAFSDEMLRIIGLSPGHHPYDEYLDRVHPEDRAGRNSAIAEAIKDNLQYVHDYRIVLPSGDVRSIHAVGKATFDSTGKPTKFVSTIQDITDLRKTEKALRESEKNLLLAQRISHLGFWVWDIDKDVLEWSDEVYRILGLAPQEFQPNYESFLSFIHPEDRELASIAVQNALDGKKPYSIDWRILRRDGSTGYAHSEGEVSYEIGKPVRMIGTIMDITERKRADEKLRNSERLYRAIGESIDYGVWVCAPDGRNIYASESFLKLVGLTQQQCSDFGWGDVLHPDDAERTVEAWKDCVRTEGTWDIEHRYRGVDGQYHPILARGLPVHDEHGKIICWAGINLDISRLKRTEAELNEAKAQAELYLDLMGHDINNMNQVGMGYLELALQTLKEEGRIEEKDTELLDKPLRAIQDSTRLIDNVRKLRSAKSKEHQLQPINLSEVLLGVKEQFSKANGRHVTINYTPIESHVLATGLVKDVFTNIVGNAIKHTDANKPLEMNITQLHIYGTDESYHKVVIEDNGPGIPDELKARIFNRFERGNTKAKGKGLGLYLVKTLVHDFNGKIWVEDRIHGDYTKGARFVVMLPAVDK